MTIQTTDDDIILRPYALPNGRTDSAPGHGDFQSGAQTDGSPEEDREIVTPAASDGRNAGGDREPERVAEVTGSKANAPRTIPAHGYSLSRERDPLRTAARKGDPPSTSQCGPAAHGGPCAAGLRPSFQVCDSADGQRDCAAVAGAGDANAHRRLASAWTVVPGELPEWSQRVAIRGASAQDATLAYDSPRPGSETECVVRTDYGAEWQRVADRASADAALRAAGWSFAEDAGGLWAPRAEAYVTGLLSIGCAS